MHKKASAFYLSRLFYMNAFQHHYFQYFLTLISDTFTHENHLVLAFRRMAEVVYVVAYTIVGEAVVAYTIEFARCLDVKACSIYRSCK